MNEQYLSLILFTLGAIGSVAIPYFRELLESGAEFEWRKLVGQFLAVVSVIAGQAVGIFEQLQDANGVVAFAAGWGISAAGRQGQKVYDAVKNKWG
jgi:O-antigen/teichoic acid export membrane protein